MALSCAARASLGLAEHDIQRIPVDLDGYDVSGAYWGAGPDAVIATTHDGNDEITVRARGVKEARAKIAAELARALGVRWRQPSRVSACDRAWQILRASARSVSCRGEASSVVLASSAFGARTTTVPG